MAVYRCKWETRSLLLMMDDNTEAHLRMDDKSIWSCSDCHVLGCMMHNITSGAANKSSFDLHEIFKSLPTIGREERSHSTRIKPEVTFPNTGFWDVSDDVLSKVLVMLGPKDLIRVAATCHHLRALASSVMPCMKLKLFPHQEAAVDWMLKREHSAEVLSHPLYMSFTTEDGFSLYINAVSGEISTGLAPTLNDFRGGMFCDEPGLGKTVTALSLILKTHGNLADPPCGVDVVWCMHNADRKCGYYELSADNFTPANFMSTWKRFVGRNMRRGKACSSKSPLEFSLNGVKESSSERQNRSMTPISMDPAAYSVINSGVSSCEITPTTPTTRVLRCTRNLSSIKRNLLNTYGEDEYCEEKRKADDLDCLEFESEERNAVFSASNRSHKRHKKYAARSFESSETWVQCDACSKWRKLCERSILDSNAAWFCSMNADPLHQSCTDPEEPWNYKRKITYFPGFYTKGTPPGKEQNTSFFTSVLKEHSTLLNSETMKALTWLANLSHDKLLEMETTGLRRPAFLDARVLLGKDTPGYHKIFRAFGLVRKVERGTSRWFYPSTLDNLAFDLTSLRIALTKPLDLFRLYLSGTTLIVVPANLVDHWKTQIQKHVSPGQLRVFIWTEKKKLSAHNLAWNYDIVITTFNRLSAEWALRKRSILMQIHWLRVILDEGHTLGSSLNMTNKLQMAISLATTNRWILTGTPTPDTPTSQVGYLLPMLKFLHEEAYGQNQELWEAGILRPFEAQLEEGRSRLLLLLQRIMISARKADLRNIPPCIKKATYLHFNEEHAWSYNELVVTVRRNILMADWNDPSHVESLLNPKQWKFRSHTVRNVRLSCCVAGHIKVTDAGQDIQETMDILVQGGLDPTSEECLFIKYSLLHGCCCFR